MNASGRYEPCCHVAALDPDAAVCGTCGRYLMRCMNFADCRSLVAALDPCPVCLGPELRPAPNARLSVGKGSRLAIPLVLSNPTSPRPLAVVSVEKREPDRPAAEVRLPFDSLEPGREREFVVEAGPFDSAGTTAIELALTLAARGREGLAEAYIFVGTLLVEVLEQESRGVNIHIENVRDAGLINLTGLDAGRERPRSEAAAGPVTLGRGERREKETGLRGLGDVMVPRDIAFAFSGFPAGDAPKSARLGPNRALSFGRVGRRTEADVAAMDVTLRAYRGGEVDAEASTRVSRHHFDLTVANARLMLLSRSMKGTLVDGERVAAGAAVPLRDGARIVPAADLEGRLGLTVSFRASGGTASRVDIARDA